MRTKIFSDTTCDLGLETLEKHDISVLPIHILLGEDDHLDGVDITSEQLFAFANEHKQLPKTAAVSLLQFQEAFQNALDNGYDELIYTGLSSELSSTFHNAILARDALAEMGYDPGRIHLVDSLQLSCGEAHLLLTAAEIVENGGTAQEAEDAMLRILPRISTHFVVDTLQYLHMGGRCSSVAYLAGSMLKLHPQINMITGSMSAGEKFRGKMDSVIQQYKKRVVLDQLQNLEPDRIFVTSTLPADKAEALADEIRALGYFKEVYVTFAGAAISSHCGPNTIGYLTVRKA